MFPPDMAPDIVPNAKPKRLSFTREKTGWGKAAFKLRFIPFLGGGPKERDEDIFTAQELASNGAASNGVAIPTLQPTSSMKNDLGLVPKVKGKRFAGVEGGGTTWVCAISEGIPENVVERAEFPTVDSAGAPTKRAHSTALICMLVSPKNCLAPPVHPLSQHT